MSDKAYMVMRTLLLVGFLLSALGLSAAEAGGRYSFQRFPHPRLHSLSMATMPMEDGAGGLLYVHDNKIWSFDGRDYRVLDASDGLPAGPSMALHFLDNTAGQWMHVEGAGWFELVARRAHPRPDIPPPGPQRTFLLIRGGGLAWAEPGGLQVRKPAGGGTLRFPALPKGDWVRGCLKPDGRTLQLVGAQGIATQEGRGWGIRPLRPTVAGHPNDLLWDRQGRLWVRTDQDLARVEPGPVASFRTRLKLVRTEGTLLSEDPFGRVWAHDAAGLVWTDGATWGRIGSEEGLEGIQATWPMLFDRHGSLWVLGGTGFLRLRGGFQWSWFDHRKGLPAGLPFAVCRPEPGAPLYVGTASGLARTEGETRFETVRGSEGWQVSTLARGPDGSLWGGGSAPWFKDTPLFRVDAQGRFRPVRVEGKGEPFLASTLILRPDGLLWMGASDGLWELETRGTPHRRQPANLPPELHKGPIYLLDRTPDGRTWASTDRLVFAEGPRGWEKVLELPAGETPVFVFQPGASEYWMGCMPSKDFWRLWRKPDGTWTHAENLGPGHPLEGVAPITFGQDPAGAWWIGCGEGALRVREGRVTRFGLPAGLPSEDVGEHGLWIDADGTLWLCTAGGVARFQPKFERPPAPLPPVTIHPGPDASPTLKAGARLKARSGPVSFKLMRPHMDGSEDWKLQIRLLGSDEGWREVDDAILRFPLLPSGDFQLQARVLAQDGTLGPVSSFPFRIDPPWHATWTMRILEGLAGLGLLVGLVALRLRRLERERQRLERLVAERTDDLVLANGDLVQALAEVRTLKGLVPICPYCKKIRDEAGSWLQLEEALTQRTEAKFSHGVCPDCIPQMRRDLLGG